MRESRAESSLQDLIFLDFCKREPRKCARPLLRLAEKAEQDSAEAKAKEGGYSGELLAAYYFFQYIIN